jgi:hypothetical protein
MVPSSFVPRTMVSIPISALPMHGYFSACGCHGQFNIAHLYNTGPEEDQEDRQPSFHRMCGKASG